MVLLFNYKVPTASGSKNKRKSSHVTKSITTNKLVNLRSLSRSQRQGHLILGGSVSSIVVPGKRTLVFKKDHQRECLEDPLTGDPDIEIDFDDQNAGGFTFPLTIHGSPSDDKKLRNRHQAHQARQRLAARWKSEVLPRVLPIYLALQASRANSVVPFQVLPELEGQCACLALTVIRVTVAHWDSLTSVELTICQCRPAPDQLISKGLFPCSPIQPSLAVDIKLLELISASSAHLTLNMTGWASLLEQFWDLNGFSLKSKGTLRHRLSSCVIYYEQLKQLADIHLQEVLSGTFHTSESRKPTPEMDITRLYSLPPSSSTSLPDSIANAPDRRDSPRMPVDPDSDIGASDAGSTSSMQYTNVLPTALIRARCPVCFGGPKPDFKLSRQIGYSADAIVCLDANFSQKRRKSRYMDSPHITSSTSFISDVSVHTMEAQVVASRAKPQRTKSTSMPVSGEILDDCERSFTAAQESRTKASKSFFEDTGLMALLCRHDRVLFLANIQSVGEKQHYALALLNALFQELPEDWMVGVLYDIGCQLHRSCEKHQLLSEYKDRIIWGISVFHAYGHQWPCQLVYHPRKRKDFGLSDGEGCERFWSSISNLVSPLRVSNHYRRLFALDLSIQHFSNENLKNMDQWFLRKYKALDTRQSAAEHAFSQCTVTVATARDQWNLQITSQTKVTPRHTKRAAEKQVADLLLLRQDLEDAQHSLDALQVPGVAGPNPLDAEEIDTTMALVTRLNSKIQKAEEVLGAGFARITLEEAGNNPFLAARLAAHGLKERLVRRVRARKFELSRLEQHIGRPALGNKLYMHTKSAVVRRETGIKAVASSFNRQVDAMLQLRSSNPQYRRQPVPSKIDLKNIFKVDVFSALWDEWGLVSSDEGEEKWKTDGEMREAIRSLLEIDRCKEERERLDWEVSRLASWANSVAIKTVSIYESIDEQDMGTRHALKSYAAHLRSCTTCWSKSLDSFGPVPTFTASKQVLEAIPSLPHHVAGSFPNILTRNRLGKQLDDESIEEEDSKSMSATDSESDMDTSALFVMESDDEDEDVFNW